MATGKAYVQRGGFIKDPEGFDNGLYSINDFEASQMDPQQRFLLDCTIMALEDAGITRAQISGTNTAVFIGCMNSDYGSAYIGATSKVGSYTATGVGTSVQAGRLSYVFNLLGPSMVLDTACSSSLIAIHQGCQAITAGECDMAICGGVNSMTLPDMYIQLCKAGMLSPTGLSQAFSDKADGYTRGEGCGIIILKRLGDALHDGDKIWATVCTGTNQDGHTVSPMTAPSGEQQKKLLHSVYGKFGVDVANLDYIEAHGTGTPAGDPVEVNALGEFFKQAGQPRDRYIGSLKTNIGHTESAAGTHCIVCFSANSKESLVGSLKTLQQDDQFLQLDVHDVSYTSTVRRDHYSHRAAFVTDSTHDLLASVGNRLERGKFSMALPKPLNVIFVFCGMGTAWQGMCTEFLTENSVFRNTMMEVDKELSAHVKWSLAQRLQQREDPTQDPVFGPLAIFACQVALASVWQSLGIQPASIVGQSIGEVAAAYTAGCLTLADAVKIVYHRSKLLANVTGGSMIVVQHTNVNRVKEVLSELDAKASIALEYSPVACAVSADAKSMSSVKGQLLSKLTSDHRLMQITDLPVSVAYHSQHVEPCVKNLGRALKGVDAASPRVEYVSAVTGEPLEDAPRAQYWMDHLRQPVLFSKAVSRAVSEKKPANTVLLEIGPKPVLPAHLNDMFPGQNFTSLPSMSRQAELKTFLQAVANLYELGANVRWEELPSQGTQITDIPRYVFNKRYNKEQTEMELILNSGCNFYRASHLYTWPIRDDVTSFKLVITPLTVPSVYDHVLSRTIVIPGALYAEAGLAVARYSNIQSPVAVSVNFERAMSLKKGEVLGLDLRFESSQNTEFWRAPLVVHKDRRRLATIRILETQQGTQQVASLDLVRSRCKEKVTRKNVYSSLRRSGFEYGEAFALLGDADRNATECLVQLEVNDKVRAEMAATRIHPCILDCMLQATLLLVPDDRGTMKDMLPKSMGKLSVYRNMESTMLIHARRKQTAPDMIVYDQRLLSLDGHVIAELDDFVVQSLTPQTDSTSSAMLKSEWHKALETPRVSSHDELQQSKRNRMIYVTNANLTQETSGVKESSKVVQYDSSSMDQNGLDAIRAALGDCSDVEAVVLIYSGDIDEAADGESVQSKLVNMCCVIQTILNTLNDHACTLPFVLCTSNAWPLIVDATPRRPVSPISTAFIVLLEDVDHAGEFHETLISLVALDIDLITSATRKWKNAKQMVTCSTLVATEVTSFFVCQKPNAEQPGANDLGQLLRFEVHKLSELSVLTEEDELFKKDCAYVVVGGLTGLGWLCVEFLARSNAGYIAIMNRRDGLFSSMERSSFEWVLTPKVKGTWNLHQLTKNIPLDYFVMHSSVASVLGNLGQANYTAGNAFLDGLAYYRRHQGLAAQTINWGPLDTGLLDNQDALKRRLDSMGFHLASQQEITETLRNLLLLNLTQAVPVKIDTELYAKKIHGTGLRPLILRYQHFVPLTTAQTTGIYNFGDLDKVKFLESAERLQAYEAYVTELTCRMLSLDVSYVTGDVSLLDLGLDSVTGNMMINQIHRDTTFKVEAVHIFAGETSVTTLAKTLDEYAQNELAKDQDQEKL
nr:hypothetical protein BaRGS_027533 [Batillaria attramentaria]